MLHNDISKIDENFVELSHLAENKKLHYKKMK